MRKILSGIVLALLVFAAPAHAVNGVLALENGQRILHVWGTNYEMGYAHGYLLAGEVLTMMESYSLPKTADDLADYEWTRDFVMETFDFADGLIQEEQGMYDGMIAAGVQRFEPVLGRDFDLDDMLVFAAQRDLAGLLCSTIIAWDTATAMDPELAGQLVVGHNTDFRYLGDDPYLAGSLGLVISYSPSDPAYQRFISLTFPGFVGVVTGMNESGIGLATNRGAFQIEIDDMVLDPKPGVGVWATRESLALRDFDGDGVNTIEDILSYYDGVHHFGSLLVQLFGPKDRGDPPAVVLEINNVSRVIRVPSDDINLAPDMMLALNWEDKLMPQRQVLHQMRYDKCVNELLNVFGREMTEANIWDFLYNERGQQPVSVTFVTAMFIPNQLRVAFSPWKNKDNVPSITRVWYDFDDLFVEQSADDDAADDTGDDDTSPDDSDDVAADDDSAADDADDSDGDDSVGDSEPSESSGDPARSEGGCGC